MPVDVDPGLNDSQQAAVRFALAAEDVAVIHGPPGTGKTTTVVELMRQIATRDEQVLACAPSNTAVDNLLERLVALGLRVVRLGHPARVAAELRDHTLDALVQSHPDTRLVRNLMQQAESLFRKASRYTRAKPARHARQELRQSARALKTDACPPRTASVRPRSNRMLGVWNARLSNRFLTRRTSCARRPLWTTICWAIDNLPGS